MSWRALTVLTPPTKLPVTMPALRAQELLEDSDHDALLQAARDAAIDMIDGPGGLGVAMCTQTWRLTLDAFEKVVRLPGYPITGVTAIRYRDLSGAQVTLDAGLYRVVLGTEPVRVVPVTGETWPATERTPGAVSIDYTLGAEPEDVPAGLHVLCLMLASHLFNARDGSEDVKRPMSAQAVHLMNKYRRGWVA